MATGSRISRRRLLAVGPVVPFAAGAGILAAPAPDAMAATLDGVCPITPEIVDGPYYVTKEIMRSDITEGKPGIPLEVRVRLVDSQCKPLRGARVDVWQADQGGIYSNFGNQGDDLTVATFGATFLRGTQVTDANGLVVFKTIYPGWYRSRTAHIHFKIYTADRARLTTQLFFPDALNEYIYTNVLGYKRAATRDTINLTDWIMAEATRGAVAQIKEEADRYVASITYGVNPLAQPAPSETMPCPPAPALCVPPLGVPPVGGERIAMLVPSVENAKRPRVPKPGPKKGK